ncbi:immunity 50 family protein [Streptomyces sp. NBC_00820]|uniref:hypothetical protein n=1 Tax=Streptomyces sp. NBC_00820 TaxID=2975842 RepID=UPI002ECFD6EB|nr:immunity 50 family protein [Streptomyces sp. NBC_00820]
MTTPETSPEIPPKTTPETTPETAPETTAEATPDWTAALTDPAPIRGALGSPVPALTEFALHCVHFDERGASVTLTFQARRLPAVAMDDGSGQDHNAIQDHNAMEFSVLLTRVGDLEIDGWTHEPMSEVRLTGDSAVLSGPGVRASFTHEAVTATAVRTFRAGSP